MHKPLPVLIEWHKRKEGVTKLYTADGMMAKGADVNECDPHGTTPLIHAAVSGSLEKVNKTLSFDPLINLSTIHMSKGGECDNVMLFTDLSRANREEMEVNPDDTHRVFYVGVTRAKKSLHIVQAEYGGFII